MVMKSGIVGLSQTLLQNISEYNRYCKKDYMRENEIIIICTYNIHKKYITIKIKSTEINTRRKRNYHKC